MLGYTHFAIAATTTGAAVLAGGGGPKSLSLAIVAGLAALLPDIDEPESVAGRRSFGLSRIFKGLFGHRGVTHSVFGVLCFAAIIFPVGLVYWGSRAMPFCFAALWGYTSHVYLGDIFTKTGVPIFKKSHMVGLPKKAERRIKVGSPVEQTIFLGVTIVGALECLAIYRGNQIRIPRVHVPLHLDLPPWFYIPPWTVLLALFIAIALVLFCWSRIHWRYKYASKIVTFKVSFSHHSEDLPLRSEQLGNLLHELLLPRYIRIFTGQPHMTVTFISHGEKALLISVPDIRHFVEHVKNALLDKLRGCRLNVVPFELPQVSTSRRYGRITVLRKSPAYSLRTLKGLEMDDPLEVLLNSMDAGPDSTSYIQLLLKPSSGSWKRSARGLREKIRSSDDGDMDRALKNSSFLRVLASLLRTTLALFVSLFESLTLHPSVDTSLVAGAMNTNAGFKDHRQELSEEAKDIVKSIDDKLNCRSSFAFEIRMIVEKEGATHYDVDRLSTAFRQYDKHQGLVGKRIYWPASRLVDHLARRNFWPLYKYGGILSSDELAGILHNPYKNTVLVKVDMNTSRSAPAALPLTATDGGRVYLGINDHRGEDDPVSVPWHDFSHHALVIGTTGSGKSTLLKSIFHQWIDSGDDNHPRGALFMEPHGDACQELLHSIPKKHIERVYYIDPASTDYPLAFNPLAYADVFSADRTKDAIIAAFHAIWSLDPSMANLMLYLPRVTDVLARSRGAHFGWIRPFIINKDFRNQVLRELDDPDADQFWDHFSSKRQDRREEEVRSLLNRIDQFVLDRRLRFIFCQSEAKVDFKSIIDEGKILICHFGDRNCGPIGKRLLGNLFCSYIHQAAQSRAEERRPFFVCMDECSEYLTPTIASILAQDRKFNIVFLAAFQYLAQTEELLAGLKGNTNTRVCFNVGEEDAVALAPLFASSSDPDEVRRRADDLMNLHRYQGFLKSTVNGRPLPPTTFNLPKPFEPMLQENEQTVMKQTIKNLCRSKASVLAEQQNFAARTELVVSISESSSEDNEEKGPSQDGYQQPQGVSWL